MKQAAHPTKAFKSSAVFRTWLERHHSTESELVVKLYKVHAKQKGLTYVDALDEALCFGWIDGVRRGGDDESFNMGFLPVPGPVVSSHHHALGDECEKGRDPRAKAGDPDRDFIEA